MRKKNNLQEATMRALLSETVQTDKEEVWNYIIDDVHHLEDFTDIEICSEEDNETAYDVAKTNLNKFTTGEIREMANEIASGNIDLVNWGHKVLESKKVEAKPNFLPVSELPDMCYGLLPSDNSIIVIKKGETGYYETDFGQVENPEEFVNNLNKKRGITPDQRFTMELRSMSGNWADKKTEAIDKEKVLNMKYEDLPDICYGVLPIDNSIIVIKKGVNGYYETDYGQLENPEEFVNKLNDEMGVTPEQRMVMELRSMNGNWKSKNEESKKTETLHADQKEKLADGTTRIKLVDGNHYQWYVVKNVKENGVLDYDIDDIEQSAEDIDYFDHNVDVNDVEEELLKAMKESKKTEDAISLEFTDYIVEGEAILNLWGGGQGRIVMNQYHIKEATPEEICSNANDGGFGCESIEGIEGTIYKNYSGHAVYYEDFEYMGEDYIKYGGSSAQRGIKAERKGTKTEAYNYNWRDDIDEVENIEENDELVYDFAEHLMETDPEYADYDDPWKIISNIICIWKINKRSRLYDYLIKWYGSEEEMKKHIRSFYETNDAIYFETGCGYSIFDADLLGGNADGTTADEFSRFVANGGKKEESKKVTESNVSNMALKKLLTVEKALTDCIMSTNDNELLDIIQPMERNISEYLRSKKVSW